MPTPPHASMPFDSTSPQRSAVDLMLRRIHRTVLQSIQFAAVSLAHAGLARPTGLRAYYPWDVLVAKRLAEEIEHGSALLDIGCGDGHRLHEIALFRDLRLARGIDVVAPASSQSEGVVQLSTFDGRSLPFENDNVDVAMVCYVLHHLHPDHARHMLLEAIRVSTRRVIVLEDSLASWTAMYRLRNWAHRVEADLEYEGGSELYKKTAGQAMFLTHEQWLAYLRELPGVRGITMESLHPAMKYQHHTMFVLELG